MKGSIVLFAVFLSLCGCKTVEHQPIAAFEGILPGMSQTEFFELISEEVEVLQCGTEFVTIRYPVRGEEETRVSHIWFLDGRLTSIPVQ